MITYSIDTFIESTVIEEGGASLYLVRNEDKVLYIGKATRGITSRWFYGGMAHLQQNIYGEWFGVSKIGQEICKNFPASRKWFIDFYTVEECRKMILKFYDPKTVNLSDNIAEYALIKNFKPTLNIMLNS